MAGVMAAVGLLVIPNRRRRAKQELREKLADVRQRLERALRGAFDEAVGESVARLRSSLDPYSRFVRSEQQNLQVTREDLERLEQRLHRLRARIESF
jgi:hypothetical protein